MPRRRVRPFDKLRVHGNGMAQDMPFDRLRNGSRRAPRPGGNAAYPLDMSSSSPPAVWINSISAQTDSGPASGTRSR